MPGIFSIHVKRNQTPPPAETADPFHAEVPVADDTLEFHAEEDLKFEGAGIEFHSEQAPYVNRVVSTDQEKVTFTVDHDPAKAGIQWPYTILVTEGPIPFLSDPTVENEPHP